MAGAKKSRLGLLFWVAGIALAGLLFWLSLPGSKQRAARTDEAQARPLILTKTNGSQIITRILRSTQAVGQGSVPSTAVNPTSKEPPAKTPDRAGTGPSASPGTNAHAVKDIFEAQVALARLHFSPGSIDGVIGQQTRSAVRAFQRGAKLPMTGELDATTKLRLSLEGPVLTTYAVTMEDLSRLQPLSKTWLGKSQQSCLDYESLLELVSEKSQVHPNLIRRLNPLVVWTNVMAGQSIVLPDAHAPDSGSKAGFITVTLRERVMQVFDLATNIMAHFPCSIAQRVEKRPEGELHVQVIAPDPNYTFDPELFPESDEARQLQRKLVLPPGPNNPVGLAWIGLDKPGYGIHGTPNPEQVGRTESHGCFRLANWNAQYVLKVVWVGMPVYVQ